jgi:AraC-like DNA-binding protein
MRSFRWNQDLPLLFPRDRNALPAMPQADVGESLACQDRLHNIRRQRSQTLREKRVAKKLSLRKFAELVGVSPTYLSQVDSDNGDPPPSYPFLLSADSSSSTT